MSRAPRTARSVKVEDELWSAALDVADARGEVLSEQIRNFLTTYTEGHTTTMPTQKITWGDKTYRYQQIPQVLLPAGLTFITPAELQGQTKDRSFARVRGVSGNPGDAYMRLLDQSEPPSSPTRLTFWRRG